MVQLKGFVSAGVVNIKLGSTLAAQLNILLSMKTVVLHIHARDMFEHPLRIIVERGDLNPQPLNYKACATTALQLPLGN